MTNLPKRRKHKDNPYKLNIIGETYTIEFKDSNNKMRKIKISKTIYEEFNKFELLDLKELNEYDNHIEHSEIYENTLFHRTFYKEKSIEEKVVEKIEKENLFNGIAKLKEPQKRRLIMYYFNDLTYDQIAKKENCSKVAIKYSIDTAINNLRKMIKK